MFLKYKDNKTTLKYLYVFIHTHMQVKCVDIYRWYVVGTERMEIL